MKKHLPWFLILIELFFYAPAAATGRQVRVGVYQNAPLIFVDQQGYTKGIFADILEYVASRENWKLSYMAKSFQQCLNLLQAGDIDLLCTIAHSPERAQRFDFSRENLLTNWGQIYIRDNSRIATMIDLDEKRIGVLEGDIHYTALKKILKNFDVSATFVETDDYPAILKLLEKGRVEAGVLNRFVGLKFNNGRDYHTSLSPIIFNPISIHYAVPRNKNANLLAALDHHIRRLKNDKTSVYYQSLDKWLGVVGERGGFPSWTKWLAAITAVLLLLLLCGAAFLRTQVQTRTAQLKNELTERQKAEEALRQSEQEYRLVVENASDAIFILQNQQIKFANRRTTDMLACDMDELMHTPFWHFISPADRQILTDYHNKQPGPEHELKSCTFRVIRKTGDQLWVQAAVVPVTWQDCPATLNFLRDISQQRRLEEQFHKVQRMESIGTLAGGIAHDFNNLLMGILGNASLSLLDINPNDPVYERIKNIENYVQNGTDLTRQLLGFARGGRYEVKPTDINNVVREQNNLFKRTHKEINVYDRLAEGLWVADVDRGQIKQVLMNLYVNARQAMPGGGDLFVQTENVSISPDYVCPYEVKAGPYIKISVTDTGIGMDQTTVQKIFEPFFTTRKMGRGTGLGLASVYGIVKNHGGFINVYSEKGKGSTFTVHLPASGKEAVVTPESGNKIFRGTELILLVDDEKMIIEIGRDMLAKLGYRVLSATGGQQAIDLYTAQAKVIDLVILDMIMPDMWGGDVYDQLKRINPGVRVILSSGYSLNGRAEEILKRGCNGFIQKPFSITALSAKIKEAMGNG